MLKRIFQLAGLMAGLVIGWRLGVILLERTAPRRLVPQMAAEPGQPASSSASPASMTVTPAQPARPETVSSNGQGEESEILVYCLSCREKRPVINAREERLSNGRMALKGECAVCGRTVMRFVREAS